MFSFLVNCILTVAVFYNIHRSLKTQDKASRKFYKHYFVVLALLLSIDNVFSFLLYRIPYYQFFKLTLLLWLSLPMGTGPHFIYNVYIRNIHTLFEGDIDTVIKNFKQYYIDFKDKYNDSIKTYKKGGKVAISFKDKKPVQGHLSENIESSDADASTTAVMSDEEEEQLLKKMPIQTSDLSKEKSEN